MTEHELSRIFGGDCLGPCCAAEYWAHAAAEYFASIDALDAAALDALAAEDFATAERRRAEEFAPSPF